MSQDFQNEIARRSFLKTAGLGLGATALSSLMSKELLGEQLIRQHAPKAKRVIFLCMAGGPSHLESFDYKPVLEKNDGKSMPESFTKGQPIAQLQGKKLVCLGPVTKFKKYGKSGQEISDFFPHVGGIADDIAIVRSMVTEQINHDPAHTFMNTGTATSGSPSMGSWVNYGLGAGSDNLPGFVVMTSVGGRNPQPIASRQWASGYLPSRFQGVEFNASGEAVNYVKNPKGISFKQQAQAFEAIKKLNEHRNLKVKNTQIDTRIAAYELAFKMQTSVPELMNLKGESTKTLEMYGAVPGDGSFASNCLLARRLVERGVRFVHLYHRGWDHHGGLKHFMGKCSGLTDKPSAALIHDLKQRGLLEDTLVVWGGEFGRTPMKQSKGGAGRDHHIKGFSMWMAGGGIKGGITHGATDDFGYNAVENVVNVRDLHATMLHLLGIKADRFTVKHAGLDSKLTGVKPSKVIHNLIQ
jgi:uncharacterized protein (DUF1501 family)